MDVEHASKVAPMNAGPSTHEAREPIRRPRRCPRERGVEVLALGKERCSITRVGTPCAAMALPLRRRD